MNSSSLLRICWLTLVQALAIGMAAVTVAIAHSWWKPVTLYWEPTIRPTEGGSAIILIPDVPESPRGGEQTQTPGVKPPDDDPLGPAPVPLEDPTPRRIVIDPDRLGPMISLAEGKAIFDLGLYPWIDARLKSQYDEEHILGAESLHTGALNTPQGAEVLRFLMDFRDDHIILYCDSPTCDAAENLARELQKIGFHKLHIMHDGIIGWKAAGYPTQKGDGGDR